MTPLRLLLGVLVLAALALVASPAIAHGGHAHAPDAAMQIVPSTARVHDAPALVLPSPCPGDDGGTCCCHGDRCTHPSQPRVCAAAASHFQEQQAARAERPRVAAHPIAVPSAQHVGAVGTRGPPASA